jgi:hydrogenase maturation protease
MRSPRVLVAGIGNIFLGDDGFGCAVIERLARRSLPDGVRVTDFGIRGLDLAYALLDGYDVTILIDAVSRGGKPGTLYIIEPDLNAPIEPNAQGILADAHTMNPMRALSLVRTMNSMGNGMENGRGNDKGAGDGNGMGNGKESLISRRILLVGCEPETLGPEEGQLGLSESAQVAVEEAVKIVESLLTDILGGQLTASAGMNPF